MTFCGGGEGGRHELALKQGSPCETRVVSRGLPLFKDRVIEILEQVSACLMGLEKLGEGAVEPPMPATGITGDSGNRSGEGGPSEASGSEYVVADPVLQFLQDMNGHLAYLEGREDVRPPGRWETTGQVVPAVAEPNTSCSGAIPPCAIGSSLGLQGGTPHQVYAWMLAFGARGGRGSVEQCINVPARQQSPWIGLNLPH